MFRTKGSFAKWYNTIECIVKKLISSIYTKKKKKTIPSTIPEIKIYLTKYIPQNYPTLRGVLSILSTSTIADKNTGEIFFRKPHLCQILLKLMIHVPLSEKIPQLHHSINTIPEWNYFTNYFTSDTRENIADAWVSPRLESLDFGRFHRIDRDRPRVRDESGNYLVRFSSIRDW